ncbi:polysaccharide biosynthesis protein [Marinobacterium litorale]|uniref:polysaccharide biosynthesis protein n=1 Tax=Marinobacterium litorale TaxID=404770 RepID=UPI0004254E6F|nr:nucleoside-diphosphate sugar epimerase/dehydratase [Marinobacterium litorale]
MDAQGPISGSLHTRIINMSRNRKKVIMVLADFIALPLALWSAYALRLADFWPVEYLKPAWWLFLITPVLGLLIFMRLGLYRAVVRFMGAQAIWAVAKGVILLALTLWLLAYLGQLDSFPRSVPVSFAFAALVYVGGSRLLVRNYYHWLIRHYIDKEPILIYGAGGAGVQLSMALMGGKEYMPVAFVDDDPGLWGNTLAGLPVHPPRMIGRLVRDQRVAQILLALPTASQRQRKAVLERLSEHSVRVKTVPSMPELVSGESLETLREVDVEDLLGREAVPPIQSLIATSIEDKVVFVSGAGGSIGSELARQAIANRPRALVLYEMGEFALYTIEQELRALNTGVPIYPVLGSVLDGERVSSVLAHFQVQTIYHAAAYKHVPLVEHNVLEGVRNNTLGTRVLAEAALLAEVERFVLISTDKAVRPTNVMGASKRLAEMVLQDMAERSSKTRFSMVRFGNVLGSSGSVVPLFRKQIKSGGPVTVTHPDITRYFMTIPEAATLVIQAGSMASGGDLFVLDMGEPVKIVDLARRMIHLMGYSLKSDSNPGGEIAIRYSGLRPGEKLHEELVIGAELVQTAHPKINRALEDSLPAERLRDLLGELESALVKHDVTAVRQVLEKAVAGYSSSNGAVVDWVASRPVSSAGADSSVRH